MGYRLSRIYTRTGDKGTTGLGSGERVDKDHPRVEAFGDVDELNSFIGVVLTHDMPEEVRRCLSRIQHELFDLGGELCIPDHVLIGIGHIERLEEWLDRFNAELPPLKEFILPGGGPAGTTCHVARTVCRRAERRVTTLAKLETINPHALTYLNRLSDLLFVLARTLARHSHAHEVLWRHGDVG